LSTKPRACRPFSHFVFIVLTPGAPGFIANQAFKNGKLKGFTQ